MSDRRHRQIDTLAGVCFLPGMLLVLLTVGAGRAIGAALIGAALGLVTARAILDPERP